jgi:hypothetical protein
MTTLAPEPFNDRPAGSAPALIDQLYEKKPDGAVQRAV